MFDKKQMQQKMTDESDKLNDSEDKIIDPISARVGDLLAMASTLFDDYHLVTRSQENFITLNEDFVVELFSLYGVRFWAGNTIILSIHPKSVIVKPKFDFDGTEEEFYILTRVLYQLLDETWGRYSNELKLVEEKSLEVLSALAQKYKDQE